MNINYLFSNFQIINSNINTPYNIQIISNYIHHPIPIHQTLPYQKTLLFRNELFEIYQINWFKNSQTTIHSHPKFGCIMKVIEGSLEEKLYTVNNSEFNEIKTSIYQPNNVSYIDDSIGLHQIKALENSISLHIYSPPKFYE